MANERDDTDVAIALRLQNSRSAALRFCLEPWGDEYPMPSGATFDIAATGPRERASIQVEFTDDSVTVFIWSGSTVRVFQGEEELGAGLWERAPAFDVPEGSDMASFVRSMFRRRGA